MLAKVIYADSKTAATNGVLQFLNGGARLTCIIVVVCIRVISEIVDTVIKHDTM